MLLAQNQALETHRTTANSKLNKYNRKLVDFRNSSCTAAVISRNPVSGGRRGASEGSAGAPRLMSEIEKKRLGRRTKRTFLFHLHFRCFIHRSRSALLFCPRLVLLFAGPFCLKGFARAASQNGIGALEEGKCKRFQTLSKDSKLFLQKKTLRAQAEYFYSVAILQRFRYRMRGIEAIDQRSGGRRNRCVPLSSDAGTFPAVSLALASSLLETSSADDFYRYLTSYFQLHFL